MLQVSQSMEHYSVYLYYKDFTCNLQPASLKAWKELKSREFKIQGSLSRKMSVEIVENRNTSWQVDNNPKTIENGPCFAKQEGAQERSSVRGKIWCLMPWTCKDLSMFNINP